jgi:hypothetical protein
VPHLDEGSQILAQRAPNGRRSEEQQIRPAEQQRLHRDDLQPPLLPLGAQALVFGAPKNRKRGRMPIDEANDIAVEFFREVGAMAASRGCVICIEPNPPAYDCDFINTTAEAVALCARIASRGVKVNGDTGAMVTNHEDPVPTLGAALPSIGNLPSRQPALAELPAGAHHRRAADALRAGTYGGWVSIEMRAADQNHMEAVARAASLVHRIYK